ncbi:MAG TPA: polysaccharide deacetylase family protein [Candidatus Binataceae bacterium]|nr:polysaccharide deacetylase family protein [Candidatus Binataceae bacterium]
MRIALKIDVDTHQGLGEGVPRLMKTLLGEKIPATFFIAMGPDNSGRAIMRAFKNPGFISKMRRTRAVSMYGLRTVLSGTLLPARPIALAWPQIPRELARNGFEVGVHGYDHVRWQDHIDDLGEDGIRAEIAEAFETFRAILGQPARAFAAPGWRTSAAALKALDSMGLDYRSDTRGRAPYRCAAGGEVIATPEIPTTLPTMDEVIGSPEVSGSGGITQFYLNRFRTDSLNVHTIHAETEGMGQLPAFAELIRALKDRGAEFVSMSQAAAAINTAALPMCEVVRSTLPGRAGWISAQGPERASAAPTLRL